MKPKYSYPLADKASIPEALLPFYIEKDGQLILDVEGAAPASRVAEFRANNEALRGDLEEIAAAATGKAAADFKGAKKADILSEITTATAAAKAAGSAKTKEEIEAAANARIDALKASHATALTTLQATADARQKELSGLKINGAVLAEATKLGLRSTAAEDITFRASRVFKLGDDGRPVALGEDGKPLYDMDAGGDPLTISNWVKKQIAAAPHLFEPSDGSGTGGGAGKPPAGGGSTVNPWDKKTWNLTEQGKIYAKDKALAIKMAAAHGVRLS